METIFFNIHLVSSIILFYYFLKFDTPMLHLSFEILRSDWYLTTSPILEWLLCLFSVLEAMQAISTSREKKTFHT